MGHLFAVPDSWLQKNRNKNYWHYKLQLKAADRFIIWDRYLHRTCMIIAAPGWKRSLRLICECRSNFVYLVNRPTILQLINVIVHTSSVAHCLMGRWGTSMFYVIARLAGNWNIIASTFGHSRDDDESWSGCVDICAMRKCCLLNLLLKILCSLPFSRIRKMDYI